MSEITLSSGIRNNLLSLQTSSTLLDRTQNRLATGKKVNSALDNPLNYFLGSSLSTQGRDLNALLDGINLAQKTVEAADNGIRAIQKLVDTARASSQAALRSAATNGRFQSSIDVVTKAAIDFSIPPNNGSLVTAGRVANGDSISVAFSTPGVTPAPASPVNLTFGPATTIQGLINAINTNPNNVDPVTGLLYINASLDAGGRLKIDNMVNGGSMQLTYTATGPANIQTFLGSYDPITVPAAGQTRITIPVSTNETRAKAAEQFNDLLIQITNFSKDSGFNGTNLLNGQTLDVIYNSEATSRQLVRGTNLDAPGLNLRTSDTTFGFQSDTEVEAAIQKLTDASRQLNDNAATFGTALATVTTRQQFTKEAVKTLQIGSDQLVLADINEEGANLLALQTRQQLSTQALSLAAQSEQSVLRLFS